MELALQVLGLRMTGKLEDARQVRCECPPMFYTFILTVGVALDCNAYRSQSHGR